MYSVLLGIADDNIGVIYGIQRLYHIIAAHQNEQQAHEHEKNDEQ